METCQLHDFAVFDEFVYKLNFSLSLFSSDDKKTCYWTKWQASGPSIFNDENEEKSNVIFI